MYKKETNTDWWSGAVAAALGAGVVTSLAIAQGQHPAIAIGITIVSVVFALICQRFGAI
jgi:hypothetical protein